MHTKFSLAHAQTIATQLAKECGQIIRSNLHIGTNRTWKADHTPVTEVDQQINALILRTIHQEFPEHNILSEEGSDLTKSPEYVWVCDPLDGTFPFMHGVPLSTVAISLVYHGQPILGVIYDPFMDRLFVGNNNKTTLNGKPIHTSPVTSLVDTSLGVVFWQDNADLITPILNRLAHINVKLHDYASVAYMDSLVASGEFSAVIFPGLSAHDSAAAKAVVEGAGGVFTSLTGELDRYDQPVHGHLAAANPSIYQEIRNLMV